MGRATHRRASWNGRWSLAEMHSGIARSHVSVNASWIGTFATTPAGAAMIQGEFSASGDFEGQYTLATSVRSGSPISTCILSVDEGTPGTSVQVDASTSQTHTLTVEIQVGAGYQGQAVCNVAATNDSKPNVGNTATIVVAGGAGDAG
jgi:hypothetical protein